MALYQKYTFVDVATLLSNLAAFGTANGWSISTKTSTRVEMAKGGTIFRIDYQNASSIRLYATPSGGTINASSVYIDQLTVGQPYMFVSCGTTLYIGRVYSSVWNWGGLINVVDKIGSWSGGAMVHGVSSTSVNFFSASAYTQATLYRNGAWSYFGASPVAGAIKGSIAQDTALADKQPCQLNAAIMPIPVTIFVCNTVTTLLHPIGVAPGLYRINAGNVYVPEETIPIGGVDYLVMPFGYLVSGSRDLLFKLSA
jgi:hypothetical protein